MKVDCVHTSLVLLRFSFLLQLIVNHALGDSSDVIMMQVLPQSKGAAATKATKTEQLPLTSLTTSSVTQPATTPTLLRTRKNVTTTTTMPVPTIEYFMFLKIKDIDDENNRSTPASPESQRFNGFMLWVSLLGVGCFLTGMIITGFVAYGMYRKLGCRCRLSCRGTHHAPPNDVEAASADRQQRPPTSGAESDLLRPTFDQTPIYTRWPTALVESYLISQGNHSLPYSSFKGLDNPWVTQFHQLITRHLGGDVTHPHSDVIVSLQPESFDRYPHRPVYVNVAIGGDDFNLDMGPADVQLTPVVEVTSVGVQQFTKPVTIRIPHRACVNDFSQWQMTLYYTTSPLGYSTSWQRRSLNSNTSDVTFTFDKNYVHVETLVPGTFVCAGVGRKQATLCVCAVAYVSWQASSHHLQLSVYICDNYTDMHKYINDLESSRNGVRASHHQSLSVYNMKDWLIKLHSASSPVWPWAEIDEDYNQAISMNEIVRRPVAPSCVTFRLRCKDSNRPVEDFQATVTIGQVRKDPSRSDNIYLVTRHVPLQEVPEFSLSGMRRKSVHEPEDESLC